MISYQDAVEKIYIHGADYALATEEIAVTDIAGRICAETIHAHVPNPAFDNSAMDGYALRAVDLEPATVDHPVTLDIAGHIAAGDTAMFDAPPAGSCYEIMTGAPLPAGCDRVVPVENTTRADGGGVMFHAPAGEKDNIRRMGEDYMSGDVVVGAGTVLQSAHILALATAGISRLHVKRRPALAVISTGREIVEAGSAPLEYGQIYNSTRPYLRSALTEMGADIRAQDMLPDDPVLFKKRLESLIEDGVDLCVSTGAVSAGMHDFVPSVLKDMGAEIVFHKVAIRPGKPIFFARLPNNGPFFIGLPGNPASSAAGLRFFIAPLLRAMQGLKPEERRFGVLKSDYRKGDRPLCFFMRARIGYNAQGVCEIEIPQKQPSFMVGPFTKTDGWVAIPENTDQMEEGDLVAFYP